jgi:long-chain acyl-CoA synthetase
MPMAPLQALTFQARLRPEGTAFIFHNEVWSYKRLADESERVAHGLVANGVKPGDRVAFHMLSRPEIIVAYYACYRLGAIAAPLRCVFSSAELARLLKRLRPALYIGETALYPNIAAIDAALLPPSRRILIDDHTGKYGVQPWHVLKQAVPVDLPTPSIHDPAVLTIPSGTISGQPKLVVHSASSLGAIANLIHEHGGLSADDFSVAAVMMAHASGIFRSLGLIQLGVPFVVIESFDADAVLDNVERYRATCLFGFPAQYAALVQAQQAEPRDLSSLRFGTMGGDAFPIELQQKAISVLGMPVHNHWVSSETAGSLAFGLKPGPVARVVDGAQIRLIDEAGADVPHGETGELLIRGPNVFAGYWDDPDATAQVLKDGWYHTGDMMRRGEDDEIWFVTRRTSSLSFAAVPTFCRAMLGRR